MLETDDAPFFGDHVQLDYGCRLYSRLVYVTRSECVFEKESARRLAKTEKSSERARTFLRRSLSLVIEKRAVASDTGTTRV